MILPICDAISESPICSRVLRLGLDVMGLSGLLVKAL